MPQQRQIAVYVLAAMAGFLLVWMIVEKHQLSECNKILSEENTKVVYELSDLSMQKLSEVIGSRHLEPEKNESQFKDKWEYNWDRKAPAPGGPEPTERRVLVLVRHGQYDFATGKLTAMGRRQANLTGLRLKQMGWPFTQIVHSSMIRAQETASLIHSHLPRLKMSEDEMIKEGGPKKPTPTVTYWGLRDEEYHRDGPRLEAAFRHYFFRADVSETRSTTDILVAHGNIIRYFMLRALQLESSAWMRIFIAHASITVIECNRDSTVTMSKFGESGHLPVDMVTY